MRVTGREVFGEHDFWSLYRRVAWWSTPWKVEP